MADTRYPRDLIPKTNWKKGIKAVDILANCNDALLGHWIKGSIDKSIDTSLGPGMEKLSEGALPTKDIPNLSCSLLGALFLLEHFQYCPVDDGKRAWEENTPIPEDLITEKNYTLLSDYFVVGWMIKSLHAFKITYNHGFSKKKEYDSFKDKVKDVAKSRKIDDYLKEWEDLKSLGDGQNIRIVEVKGEARINHEPTNLNYWHFTIDSYPAENDIKPIQNASDGWRYNLAINMVDFLRRTFIYLEGLTSIPQITDKYIWEKR